MNNFFQQFDTDWLEGYWSEFGGSMGSQTSKDGYNAEDLRPSGTLPVMSDRLKSLQRMGYLNSFRNTLIHNFYVMCTKMMCKHVKSF